MPRLLPRFSLLTALLLMTIVGMAIVLVQLWREVGPLREANRRMREELGLLAIEDPTKAYAITIPTTEDYTWKWRIYLPPGGKYSLNDYSGHLPSRHKLPGKAWFDGVRDKGVGSSNSGTALEGEFTLEVRAVEEGGKWLLTSRYTKRDGNSTMSGGGKISIYQPSGDWLSNRRSSITGSDVSAKQKSFDPAGPILLLHLQRPIIKDLPGGGHTSRPPTGSADGFAVWIEGLPPTKTSKEGSP